MAENNSVNDSYNPQPVATEFEEFLFEEIETLLKPKTQRVLPVKKSKTELKRMLKGDLIELVISYQ